MASGAGDESTHKVIICRIRSNLMTFAQLALFACALLPLVLLLLIAVASPAHAHDQLARSPRRQPPAIYSYSAASGEPPFAALESHRARMPYSWTNRRLGRVLTSEEEEYTNQAAGPSQRQTSELGALGEQQDYSLLYNSAGTKTRTAASGKRPAVGANRRRLRPQRGGGGAGPTKGGSSGVASGTKTRTSVVGTKTRPPVVALSPPNYSPSHAAEANTTLATRRGGKRKHLVCYYGTWAVYRPDAGKFPVENIDPFLCTHVIYGFTGLSYDNMIKPLDPWNDLEDNYGKGAMKRFTNLKRVNPDLKTIVAIGGWNEGSIKYSKMASDPEARAKFVDSVMKFLDKYNFDGLDLDWEYPGSRGGASYDKQNFVKLTRELHSAFQPRGYLLTAAVSAGKWFIDPAYDIAQVSRYLDLINLMAYDYHGGWETKTGMNAPLFSSPKHDLSREDAMLNVNWSVNYWLAQGAPREKLMLGVGSYGRSFTLDKAQVNGLNAPASQKGRAGPYTREPGSLGYNELCEYFAREPASWTIVRDPDYLAPYAYNQNERQWVGYDDQESLALKAQFAKSMGLGGMMMWSIETDDFRGLCHGEKFPLLNTLRRVMDGGDGGPMAARPTSTSTTTQRPAQTQRPTRPTTSTTTTTTKRPGEQEVEDDGQRPPVGSSTRRPVTSRPTSSQATSQRPPFVVVSSTQQPPTSTRRPRPTAAGQEFTCRAAGMFADPRNCRKFIRCVELGTTNQQWQTYKFDCGPGTAFNEAQGYCDHIYNVPTCNSQKAAAAAAAATAATTTTTTTVDVPTVDEQQDGGERTMIGSSQSNSNNNYLRVMGAHAPLPPLAPQTPLLHVLPHYMVQQQQRHLMLAHQYYPNHFQNQQHQFMMQHQGHHHESAEWPGR